MYLEFFRLREQPFGVNPDPTFLYLSQTHKEALEALRTDFVNDRGFLTLVGEPGLGKTTMLYKLMEEWSETSRIVFLFQTQCDSREFFQYLLAELGVDTESMGLVAMHQKLNHILFQEMLAGRRFVLIVDEAQNLGNSVLETIRGLSNFETAHAKLLNIVLAGQPQLAEKLASPDLRQLRQRIGILNRLRPLTASETGEYINCRLAIVGYQGDSIFTFDAVQSIARASHGAPRTINHICHQALSAAATRGVHTIDLEIAQNAIARLDGRTSLAVTPSPVNKTTSAPISVPARDSNGVPPSGSSTPTVRPPDVLLSYAWSKKSNSRLWSFAAIASCVLLLAGIAYAIPSVRRFAMQEYKSLSSTFQRNPPDSGVPSGSDSSPATRMTPATYDPDPQENQSSEVITVASRAGQTVEELSRIYVGRFDDQIYKQICELNPGLKNVENLETGQLIRLPLAPGTLKKAVDTADHKEKESDTWQLAVAKIKGLFFSPKR